MTRGELEKAKTEVYTIAGCLDCYNSNVGGVNYNIEQAYDLVYSVLHNGTKKVDESLFPDYYKISSVNSEMYISWAIEKLKAEGSKIENAINELDEDD